MSASLLTCMLVNSNTNGISRSRFSGPNYCKIWVELLQGLADLCKAQLASGPTGPIQTRKVMVISWTDRDCVEKIETPTSLSIDPSVVKHVKVWGYNFLYFLPPPTNSLINAFRFKTCIINKYICWKIFSFVLTGQLVDVLPAKHIHNN